MNKTRNIWITIYCIITIVLTMISNSKIIVYVLGATAGAALFAGMSLEYVEHKEKSKKENN